MPDVFGVQKTMDCLMCLGDGTCMMKLDKRGRPYLTCFGCGTRTFIHSAKGLIGPRLLGKMLPTIRAQMNIDAETVEAEKMMAEL